MMIIKIKYNNHDDEDKHDGYYYYLPLLAPNDTDEKDTYNDTVLSMIRANKCSKIYYYYYCNCIIG